MKASTTYFGTTNFRDTTNPFGILQKDRLHHFYILGKTGTGKTNVLYSKILQDVFYCRGLCLIDIHGDLSKSITKHIPKNKLMYLDATNPKLGLGYNPLKKVSHEKQALVVSSILDVFEKVWGRHAWGVKQAHILRNILLTLLRQKTANFSDVTKLLLDKEYRKNCLENIQDKELFQFWEKEFINYTKHDFLPIFNKIGGLLSYPPIRKILIENKTPIYLREIMDKGKVLIVNLSKGHIGKEPAYILASLLVTSLSSASFSRIDTKEKDRRPFFLYFDEFQHYTNLSIIEMLSELRKFNIGVIMAHQYLGQLDQGIREAVLGNVGSILCFRLSYSDAKIMEKEFYPSFTSSDFINLPNHHFYIKLMIQGVPSKSFSGISIYKDHFMI
jgi:type IV secretory pathway TraG/TraD family ATPase VirD4